MMATLDRSDSVPCGPPGCMVRFACRRTGATHVLFLWYEIQHMVLSGFRFGEYIMFKWLNMAKGKHYLIIVQQMQLRTKPPPSRKSNSLQAGVPFLKHAHQQCRHCPHLKISSNGTGLLFPQVSLLRTLRSFWNTNRLPSLFKILQGEHT